MLLVSLIEILLMLSAIIGFAVIAYPIDKRAAYCFIPYIAWVSFASLLNAAICYLN
jgi:tryptophan-rich sensory protein